MAEDLRREVAGPVGLRVVEELGRRRDLDDLAGAAIFLCSPAASYVTGQVLYVDGGYLASI